MADVKDAVVVDSTASNFLKAAANPQFIASMALLIGLALAVAGVYVLAGIGWALLAGAAPMLSLAAVLIRGLMRAE